MAVPSPDIRWHVAASEIVDWREWDDEFVVRIESRAETHLLSPAAGNVLLALLDGRPALTLHEIDAKAFTGTNTDTEADLESLQAVLADLERLAIVARSPT